MTEPARRALGKGRSGIGKALPVLRAAPALLRRRPPRSDLVLFDSWNGRCSDSPRAISFELQERAPQLRQVWVLAPGRGEAPPAQAAVVRPQSPEQVTALRTAGLVVTNRNLPRWYLKPPGAGYLQTWHGSPLKRVGFDVPRDRREASKITYDVARWDVLMAQSPFAATRFREAFRFAGPVWEDGYPHNDVLVGARAASRRREVRRRLGLGDDARVVFYAPTFREYTRADGGPRFDLQLDTDRFSSGLGPDWVLLVRAHHTTGWRAQDSAHVRDVSGVEEITDLYLAADVLVTDYSSAMFDFAVTGKPMLFFTYDLERYRDSDRGFYWSLEDESPGPVVRDTGALVAALRDLPALETEYAARYAAFRHKFCPYDDGAATRRTVERLLDTLLPDRVGTA